MNFDIEFLPIKGGSPFDVDMGIISFTGTSDRYYEHIQSNASAIWHITHNLKKHPSVSVVDSAGSIVVGDVSYIDDDTVDVIFSAPFSGRAYLN